MLNSSILLGVALMSPTRFLLNLQNIVRGTDIMGEKDKAIYQYNGGSLTVEDWDSRKVVSFEELVQAVKVTHSATQDGAVRAINRMQTMRNWIIGYYIAEFELKGRERAEYGEMLFAKLAERVAVKGLSREILTLCCTFYKFYPQMSCLLGIQSRMSGQIGDTPSHQLKRSDNKDFEISDSANHQFISSPESIISKLSFSHLRILLAIDDPLVRYFYEQQCMRGTWSVRELRRQVTSNLHIRVGLSQNPEKCLALAAYEENSSQLMVRDPYTLEFLGLRAKDVVTEADLENALIAHLQEFLLECGNGLCFEARQKRIIIDDEYYFPDLVFYSRYGHFSLIVELKNEAFSHENLGQLNSYVSYWKKNEMRPGDNPPVGLLLCTRKGEQMVEYALAGMDNQLFVSTYQLQLPDKKALEDFLLRQLEENKEDL